MSTRTQKFNFIDNIYIMYIDWGRNKMTAILQTTFSNKFSWIKNIVLAFLALCEENPLVTGASNVELWVLLWDGKTFDSRFLVIDSKHRDANVTSLECLTKEHEQCCEIPLGEHGRTGHDSVWYGQGVGAACAGRFEGAIRIGRVQNPYHRRLWLWGWRIW